MISAAALPMETSDFVIRREDTSDVGAGVPNVEVPPHGLSREYEFGTEVDHQESAFNRTTTLDNGFQATPLRPVVAPKPTESPDRRVQLDVLQDWEGVVETVEETTFSARLRDITAGAEFAWETAELPIDDVTEDDRELVRPGAVFYMTIGRMTHPSGRRDRVARLVFRRLPAWTASTLQQAQQRANALSDFFASAGDQP